jgi:uncharacterized protein (DUF58 family)
VEAALQFSNRARWREFRKRFRPDVIVTRLLWRNYRFSSALKHRFQRRFTPAGALILAAALMCAGIGVDTNQAVAYQAFTLLAALVVVSLLWSFGRTPKFIAQRLLPRVATAGQPLLYRVVVTNLTRHPQFGISVGEDFGDPRPGYEEFANNPEPGEKERNPFDRFFRFYRWLWLIARKQIATGTEEALPPLVLRKPVELQMRLTPQRRGHLHLQGVKFAVPDPFGLCRSYTRHKSPASVLVLPKRYRLPQIDLPGSMEYQPGGVTLASNLGESEEFVALREYRRGDPLRHIHWKSVGKTGKLVVKEFQNEYFVRHALILDTFLERSDSPVFEEAISVAASFACELNTQETLLDLLFVGPHAYSMTTGHGVCQVDHLLEILASVQPCTTKPFSELGGLVLQQIGLVSGCVCVFLNWDEDRQELVRQLQTLAVPLLVIVLKEPGKRDPAPGTMAADPARFHVLEAGNIEEGLASL